MSKKLWGGRFKKGLAESAIKLSFSVDIDKRLVQYDIKVNRAHAKALLAAGIFSKPEFTKVDKCLDVLSKKFEKSDDLIADDEDIHSCIERLVTEVCGDLGKKLHTGKSRNDQVITDTRLFVKDECVRVKKNINALQKALVQLAEKHHGLIFPGFTHFQPALPILFSHHILAYFEKFKRDFRRFETTFETSDVCALGAGAMAGNNYGLDREGVAKKLGFSSLTLNSMDAVSDRDFILEFLSAASFCMTHLSRFCEEIIVWNSPILGFISLGDDFTTGSSIMPQKKNPDMAELIRGKSGRVMGHLVSLQTILKGLPLTYNRDLQEDKELLFDTTDTLNDSLECFTDMIKTLKVNKVAVAVALRQGHLLATDFADYLVGKGVPFRDSHEITGKAVMFAIEKGCQIDELTLQDLQQFSKKVEQDVHEALCLESSVKAKNIIGGTNQSQVAKQIKQAKAWTLRATKGK
ncbi:argininosuccinate lyase [Candidatus Marinamargulisbacteria bacterium SCGC AAA071-K20]|nr:argininosuccinate lyase [Candidatus Marinamargulisbacteria bacterium SCGC AAA071-K20]